MESPEGKGVSREEVEAPPEKTKDRDGSTLGTVRAEVVRITGYTDEEADVDAPFTRLGMGSLYLKRSQFAIFPIAQAPTTRRQESVCQAPNARCPAPCAPRPASSSAEDPFSAG
ncbi:MAG: acyl carrier protein [Desulfobacterales bacterium]|nr:acyl carrier protein [Desulfobacterales bacterium]